MVDTTSLAESKWRAKVGSLNALSNYLTRVFSFDRDLLSACLPELVSIITPMLHDTKQEVADLSKSVLQQAMNGITNRDLEPFTNQLLNAIINRQETEETMVDTTSLAESITFGLSSKRFNKLGRIL